MFKIFYNFQNRIIFYKIFPLIDVNNVFHHFIFTHTFIHTYICIYEYTNNNNNDTDYG